MLTERLWDRRTCASVLVSVLLATGVAVTVTAAKPAIPAGSQPSCTASQTPHGGQ